MFIVLLTGGILGYVFRGRANTTVMMKLTQKMDEYNPSMPTSQVTRAWDETQVALKCCGIQDQDDWVDLNDYYKVAAGSPRVSLYWLKVGDFMANI